MSYKNLALGAVGALMVMAVAQATQATTLADLIGAGPITNNGLVYSNFTDGGSLPASQVTVTFTSTGVQFTANWNTLTPGHDQSVIGYHLAVVDPATQSLTSGSLSFAGHVIINNAAASVGETLKDVSNQNSNAVYKMQVYYDGPGGLADNLSDSVTFAPPVTQLDIIKSIDLAATFNSFASLNFVDNNFVQGQGTGVTPPVPEPMSLALLPLALLGLGLRKKLAR